MGQSSGTCGRGTVRRDSGSQDSQQTESSKEWMFQGTVAVPNLSGVDWDDKNDPVPDEVRKGFPEVGEQLKASFSHNAPAEIEYSQAFNDNTTGIVIVSYIEKVNLGQLHDRREQTVAVAVWRTALDKTMLYPFCKRTKLKTAVWSTPARKQAVERIDETYLFRRQVDDAERITAIGIMINVSKQHAETSHGIKNLVND